ncbi:SPOSA6832_04335, partial [Sporobolomyces salmonicolor]
MPPLPSTRFYDYLPHFPALVLYSVLLFLTVHLLISLSLRFFAPSFSIGHLSLRSINNLSLSLRDGLRIEVRRVGLCGWSGGKAWFVLQCEGVRVVVPRSFLLCPPPRPPKQQPRPRKPAPKPAAPSRVANFLSSLLARLSGLLVLFSLQLDFTIEVEEVAVLGGLLEAGGEVRQYRRRKVSGEGGAGADETHVAGAWVTLQKLELKELLPSRDGKAVDGRGHAKEGARKPALCAVEMQDKLTLSISAPLAAAELASWRPKRRSVKVALLFDEKAGENYPKAKEKEKGKEKEKDSEAKESATGRREAKAQSGGVQVRIHELKRVLRSLDEVMSERKRRTTSPPPPDRSQSCPPSSSYAQPDPFRPPPPPNPRRPSPLTYLHSLSLSLPSLILSSHYTTPSSILASSLSSENLPLPQTITFALLVRGVKAELELGGRTDGEKVRREHREWLGKGREIDAMGSVEWKEIEGRVKDIPPPSSKTLSIGPSRLDLTSTWLPPSLSPPSLPLTRTTTTSRSIRLLPLPVNYNDRTVIFELFVGQIRGQTTFETFDAALRIFMARPRPSIPTRFASNQRPDEDSSCKTLASLPRVIGTLVTAGVEFRVQAPQPYPAPASRTAPSTPSSPVLSDADPSSLLGDPVDPFFAVWTSPELFCMSDVYGLEYYTRFSLTMDIASVYILGTNHGAHDDMGDTTDSEAGWPTDSPTSPTLPSNPVRLDVLSLGPIELCSNVQVLGNENVDEEKRTWVPFVDLGTCRGEHGVLLETIEVDLWRPVVMSCLRGVFGSFASASATSSRRGRTDSIASSSSLSSSDSPAPPPFAAPKPLVDLLLPDQALYVAFASVDLRIAGVDLKADEHYCRGVAVHSGPLVAEYLLQKAHVPGLTGNFADRAALEMREDIRVEANATAAAAKDGDPRQTLIKLALRDLHAHPVVDARASRGHKRYMPSEGGGKGEEEDWELRGRAEMADTSKRRKSLFPPRLGRDQAKEEGKELLFVPHLTVRVKVLKASEEEQGKDGAGPLDQIVVNVDAETISFRLELYSIYLCLVAIHALRSLKSKVKLTTAPNVPSSSSLQSRRPLPLVKLHANIGDLHIFPTLPHNTLLFINFRRVRVQFTQDLGITVDWDVALLAGDSSTVPGKWEDIIRLRVSSLAIRPQPDNDGLQPFVVSLTSETARLRIPFRYVFSRIVDNAVSLVKATKQLVHEHIKGGQDFILEPHAEDAKRLPKVDLQVGLFAIEMQDDPFETKLNIIWRAGYEEQNARLDREVAFEAKAEAIRRWEANGGRDDSEDEVAGSAQPGRTAQKVGGDHSISVEEAKYDLLAYNSSHWVKRIRNAAAEQARREEALTRRLYGAKHLSSLPDSRLPIDLMPASKSSPLARATFHDLRFVVSKPSFGHDGLADFLHDVGKGLPTDTTFTLLVPLHFAWKMEEARVQLRDYPLPLLHIPSVHRQEHASWECEADLVVAEETGGPESVRRVPCPVIPQQYCPAGSAPYTIVVPRSAMTVKTYATPTIHIRTSEPTRVGWGNAIQPAIQDVARVLDTLTKASPDPSDRLGFWDKIRLQLHWRVQINFDGPKAGVIFHLKGSRDPYALTGFGSGFAKAWRANVKFLIGFDNPDREFFQILSEEYILGIPNLREYIDTAATGMSKNLSDGDDSSAHGSTAGFAEYDGASDADEIEEESAYWIKICAKCINGVRWGMGLVPERTCRDDCEHDGCRGLSPFHRQCRIFDFIPHWKDSFAGFRSDFVHFSLSLTSPATLSLPNREASADPRDDASVDYVGEHGYNSFHFTPQAITHFQRWWKLFDGTMSLPIRQGKLFPSAQAPSKKFGKHCATIKYRFSLAPLFISHTYRQESWAEWARGETTVLGLKGKIGRFNVDLHQREQEMVIRRPEASESKIVKHKAFYMAEVDLDSVDLRTIVAKFKEPEKAHVAPADAEMDEDAGPPPTDDFGVVGDEDVDWINLNDFNDSAYTIGDRHPRISILPLMVCPRFTYYRHVDSLPVREDDDDGSNDGEAPTPSERPKTKFGTELSHTCLMGCATGTLRGSTTDRSRSDELELRVRAVHRIIDRLRQVRDDARRDNTDNGSVDGNGPPPAVKADTTPQTGRNRFGNEDTSDDAHLPHLNDTLYQEWGDWENRYMVHNPTIQVSNATREVLLKYYYSSRDRKGFVYHVSASAIKFIRDLAKEHERKHRRNWSRRKSARTPSHAKSGINEAQQATNRLLDELTSRNGGSFWATSEQEGDHSKFGDALDVDPETAADALPEGFESNSSHLCMIISPQVSLQSDVDEKSTIILTAFRTQVKVFSVVDSRVPDDPVNYEILHQNFATLDGLQIFCPRQQANRGERRGEFPFVPLETLVDLRIEPWGFDRVVPRTSAALRYDKFNQLRIRSKKAPDHEGLPAGYQSHFETATDRISIEADKFSVSATPAHFAAIYNVITDLILYSDPIRKSRNTKLEALVFTRDFSDLSGVIESVSSLQQRLRGLTALLLEYQVHFDELDEEGLFELFLTRAEFNRLSDELNLVIEALSRARQSNGSQTTSKRAGLQLEGRAAELTWHMLDKTDLPFAKFSVIGAEFSWVSKQDSSTSSRLVIKDLRALNSSPDQVFAEIIAKHDQAPDNELAKVDVFAAALWNALAPVGGISIVERFELHLHPVRLQLEHRVGRQILDYLFAEREKPNEDDVPRNGHPSRQDSSKKPTTRAHSSVGVQMQASQSVDSLIPGMRESQSSSLNVGADHYRSANPRDGASSSASVRSADHRLRRAVSTEVLSPAPQEEGLDADEMRRRAALNRAFLFVEMSTTVLCLTYRSEKEDHSSLPNIYNITYKTPAIQYRMKTWSFLDLLNEIKRDMIKSVWQQKGQLIQQLLSKTHRRLPMAQTRSAAKQAVLKSSLRYRLKLKSKMPSTSERNDPLLSDPVADSPRSPSTSSISSSPSSGRQTDGDEPLPFDTDVVKLIDPTQPFQAEPEEVSIVGDGDGEPSRHVGFPYHNGLRKTLDLRDDEKAALLMGKSLE